ncbi:MAG: hypothetical protein IJW43_01555 [Clostridia bacterium]|nr:hypothetical protein [Clostridia bacterium]
MNEEFKYDYSAPTESERKQIESIKKQYVGSEKVEKTPFERLKYLHEKVNGRATCVSLIFGILGCLIFGLGLTMVLEWNILVWGVLVMAIGIVPMCFAYPAYNKTIKKGKEKYGEEIIKLSEELLKEKK